MAIGENSYFNSGSDNNATRRNTPEYSYYSRYSFMSSDKSVNLKFEFRSGLMQCKLYQRASETSWNQDPTEIIYLSPTKAAMLSEQITKFKEYMNSDVIDESVAFGVNGGMNEKVSFIAFHTNENKDVFITIGKFDGNGTITEKLTCDLRSDFNYGLKWNNLSNMDIEKVYYKYIELDLIHNMVTDFARNMSGALGYSVNDIGRYDVARILNKMDPIYDKMGIERINSSNSFRQRGTNNFLNSAGSSNSTEFNTANHSEHTSIDSLIGG